MTLDEVGARLKLLGVKRTLENLDSVSAAYDKLALAIDKMGESAKAAGIEVTTALKQESAVSTASVDKQVAQQEELAAATTRTTNATKVLRDEQVTLAGTLDKLAAGPLGKLGKWGLFGGAAAMYEGIKFSTQFHQNMLQLTTQAGIAHSRLGALSTAAKEISNKTGVGLTTVAKQFYRIASSSAGLNETNRQLERMTRASSDLSVLFNVGTTPSQAEQTARIIGAMNTYKRNGGRGFRTIRQGEALINSAVGAGDIRGGTMVAALGSGILSATNKIGGTLSTSLSLLDLMTRYGAQPRNSSTLISHALQTFTTASGAGQKMESMLGITSSTMQNIIDKQGFTAAFKYMNNKMQWLNPLSYMIYGSPVSRNHVQGTNAAIAEMESMQLTQQIASKLLHHQRLSSQQFKDYANFMNTKMFGGGKQDLPIVTALLSVGMFTKLHKEILKNATISKLNHDIKLRETTTPHQQLEKMRSSLHNLFVTIGEQVTPAFVRFAHAVSHVTGFLQHNKGLLDGIMIAFGGLVGVSGMIWTMSKFIKGYRSLRSGFGMARRFLGRHGIGTATASEEETAAGTMQTAGDTMVEAADTFLTGARLVVDRGAFPNAGGLSTGAAGAEAGAAGAAAGDATAMAEGGLFSRMLGKGGKLAGLAGLFGAVTVVPQVGNIFSDAWHYNTKKWLKKHPVSGLGGMVLHAGTAGGIQLGHFMRWIAGKDHPITGHRFKTTKAHNATIIMSPHAHSLKNVVHPAVMKQIIDTLQKEHPHLMKKAEQPAHMDKTLLHQQTRNVQKQHEAATKIQQAAEKLTHAASTFGQKNINVFFSPADVAHAVTKHMRTKAARS